MKNRLFLISSVSIPLRFVFAIFFSIAILTSLLAPQKCLAETEVIELPQEELAKETVLPRFDHSVSVKNRNVSLEKKFEVGGFFGFNFSEAIFNQAKFGIISTYHASESNAFTLQLESWASGLSQYGEQLKSRYGFQYDRAPRPVFGAWFNWEITAYYGKISLTKMTTANLSFYPILGVGATNYTHKTFFGFDGGMGLKLFFTPGFALRTDLKLQYAQQTTPFLAGKMVSGPAPQYSDFPDKWVMSTIVDIGLVGLF